MNMNNKFYFLPPSVARIWTEVTLTCHNRGCICSGCVFEKRLESTKCKAKKVVLALIQKGIYPPEKIKKYNKGIRLIRK